MPDEGKSGRGGKIAWGLAAVLAIVLVVWLYAARQQTPPPVPPPRPPGPLTVPELPQVSFVELIYVQAVDQAPEELPPRPANPRRLDGYVYQAESRTLYPSMGGTAPAPTGLLLGRRVHYSYLHDESDYQALAVAGGDYATWDIAAWPGLNDLLHYGHLAWYRLPVTVSATPAGESCRLQVAGETVTLAPGETKTLWQGEKTFSYQELAAEISRLTATATGRNFAPYPEGLAARLERSQDEALTLHGRLIAVHHGRVGLAPVDLEAERSAGMLAMQDGRFPEAIAHFDRVLAAVPQAGRVAPSRERAAELLAAGVTIGTLSGSVKLPDGSAAVAPRAWVGLRTPDDPADRSRVISPLADGGFRAQAPSGNWIVSIYVPGFQTVTRTVYLQEAAQLDVQLTDADRRRPETP